MIMIIGLTIILLAILSIADQYGSKCYQRGLETGRLQGYSEALAKCENITLRDWKEDLRELNERMSKYE